MNSGILAIVGIAGAIIFMINYANASLDFYGSIGFDMFDDRPFNNNNNDYNDYENEVTVRIDLGEGKKNSKIGYPDFEVRAGSEEVTVYGEEFTDDGKAKVRLDVNQDTDRVCIETLDVDFKKCKAINDNNDEVAFNLKEHN